MSQMEEGYPRVVALIDLRVNDAAMQLRPVTYRECVTLTLIMRREKIAVLKVQQANPNIDLMPSAIGAESKVSPPGTALSARD